MDDYALVLNAGSSRLKFSVYHRADAATWHLQLRGQIDGIGSSPRLTASENDVRLADEKMPDGLDGRGALEALARWLRSRYGGARVLGVGHRVVHGGAWY